MDFALKLLFGSEVLWCFQVENPNNLDDLVDDLCQVKVLQDFDVSLRVSQDDDNRLEGRIDAREGANSRNRGLTLAISDSFDPLEVCLRIRAICLAISIGDFLALLDGVNAMVQDLFAQW